MGHVVDGDTGGDDVLEVGDVEDKAVAGGVAGASVSVEGLQTETAVVCVVRSHFD